jgi:hypothetical protein
MFCPCNQSGRSRCTQNAASSGPPEYLITSHHTITWPSFQCWYPSFTKQLCCCTQIGHPEEDPWFGHHMSILWSMVSEPQVVNWIGQHWRSPQSSYHTTPTNDPHGGVLVINVLHDSVFIISLPSKSALMTQKWHAYHTIFRLSKIGCVNPNKLS